MKKLLAFVLAFHLVITPAAFGEVLPQRTYAQIAHDRFFFNAGHLANLMKMAALDPVTVYGALKAGNEAAMYFYFGNACSSAATANWPLAGTWTTCGGTFPGAGDTATINAHTVTCPSSTTCSVGASGASGTIAITHQSGGTLNINGTLDMFGDLSLKAGTTTVGPDGILQIDSPTGSQYKVVSLFAAGSPIAFNCAGTSWAHPATVQTAGLGSHGYIDLGVSSGTPASQNISFCYGLNIGDTAGNGWRMVGCTHSNSCTDTTVADFRVKNSGIVRFHYGSSDGKEIFTLARVDIRGSLSTSDVIQIQDDAALASPGVRTIQKMTLYNNSAAAQFWRLNAEDFTIGVLTNNVCTTDGVLGYNVNMIGAGNDHRTNMQCVFAALDGNAGSGSLQFNPSPMASWTITDSVLFSNIDNPHPIQEGASTLSLSANIYQKIVCDGNNFASSDSGDFVIGTISATIQTNILISRCGTLWTNLNSTMITTANHNTQFNNYGGSMGENNGSATQMLSLRNNLFVQPPSYYQFKADGIHMADSTHPVSQSSFTVGPNAYWAMPCSGDAGAPTCTQPQNLPFPGGVASYFSFPQKILANEGSKTATAGTSATNVTCSACDFVTDGVTAQMYVIKTNGAVNTYARVASRTDLHNLVLVSPGISGLVSTDTFDVRISYWTSTTNGYGDAAAFGSGDIHANPNFVDSTRTLATWDTSLGGAGTVQSVGRNIVTINGWDYTGAATTATTTYTVAAALAYIRGGFTPTNVALRGTASDGGDIGAVAVSSSTCIQKIGGSGILNCGANSIGKLGNQSRTKTLASSNTWVFKKMEAYDRAEDSQDNGARYRFDISETPIYTHGVNRRDVQKINPVGIFGYLGSKGVPPTSFAIGESAN